MGGTSWAGVWRARWDPALAPWYTEPLNLVDRFSFPCPVGGTEPHWDSDDMGKRTMKEASSNPWHGERWAPSLRVYPAGCSKTRAAPAGIWSTGCQTRATL